MFTEEDYQLIEREVAPLRDAAKKRCVNREQYELVLKAFEFANEAHKNVRRRSGEPYILHPIAVAKIVVSEIGLGCKSICAALLHDVVEDTDFTVEDIERHFGAKIASLVDGLTKIKVALDGSKNEESLQAENFKRILLTLNDDVRIVLIKMADRLHNVRTIQYMPEYKRDKILSETMYIFIPLANKLGLGNIKSEMENIWLQYREPDAYKEISTRLEAFEKERSGSLEEFINPIRSGLENNGYEFKIIKRLKSPYSIWHKMKEKNIPFDEIFDIYAIRIIFKPKEGYTEREQCWHIFSTITGIYSYKNDRTRDWLKEPKSNGYEALHLTAMSNRGYWVECQIRSERMNAIAERGLAAHWLYKRAAGESMSQDELNQMISRVREIIENPDANAIKFLDDVHKELTTSEIYIFTRRGEPKSMPAGSTALDFAYFIHTDIGNSAIAAKVNQKLVPLSTVLKNGDQIEIITAGNSRPKREWLNFLQSNKARCNVLDSLRAEVEDSIGEGYKILERELSERGITERINVLKKLLSYYKLENKNDLYSRIGIGVVDLSDLDKALKNSPDPQSKKAFWGIKFFSSTKSKVDQKADYVISDKSDSSVPDYHIADCCSPVPGDSSVGFIEDDGSITVHKKSCPVATNLASMKGNRVVAVKWSKQMISSFPCSLSFKGIDRLGMLSDITKVISSGLGINMRKIQCESHDGVFDGTLEIDVHTTEDVSNLLERIKGIKGIKDIWRTETGTNEE